MEDGPNLYCKAVFVLVKNLCGGFQFLLILDLWGISFHAVAVFGLGKNLLFKSVLGHCELLLVLVVEGDGPYLFHLVRSYQIRSNRICSDDPVIMFLIELVEIYPHEFKLVNLMVKFGYSEKTTNV